MFRTLIGVLCTIGAGFAVIIIFAVSVGGLPARPRQTNGTIVGYDRELTGASLDSLRYFPVVDYTNSSGAMDTFRSWSGLTQPKYPTGAVVRIVYFPRKHPKQSNAEIFYRESLWAARAWAFWLSAVLAFVFIIPLVALAYGFLNGKGIREIIRV